MVKGLDGLLKSDCFSGERKDNPAVNTGRKEENNS